MDWSIVDSRLATLGGVIGPACFAAGWLVAGGGDTSAVGETISRLAARDASTRPVMTAGFVGFGIGVGAFAAALRRTQAGGAWITTLVTAAATLGVAATPLDSGAVVDSLHGVLSITGYAAVAATPLLAAPALRAEGRGRWAAWSVALGVTAAAGLAASLGGIAPGVTQRLGLTAGHLWLASRAVDLLGNRR